MAKRKIFGSVKRFGPRYGRTVRGKVAHVESKYKKKLTCPYCNKIGVKRVAAGIWECSKCSSKFTGKAYEFDKKKMMAKAKEAEA
ncbi:MAG: 50S ribosomal protein L37ae [Candidatus Woesearchaeota archaeon]